MATNQDLPTIPRRRLGRTELSIPVVPFGTQGFGNNFGPVSDEEAVDLIKHAVSIGVNHFDCAPLLWGFNGETRSGVERDPA